MQKFKLRSNDLDTLYSIFKHSSLTPLDIKQLKKNELKYFSREFKGFYGWE